MKRLLTLFWLLTTLHLSARHYDLTAQRITTADGLPSNTVARIWQDETGYMWIDTRNGLCRYDGYEMTAADRRQVPIPHVAKELKTRDALWQRMGNGKIARRGHDGSTRCWQLIPPTIIAYTHNDHFAVVDVDERTEAISTYGSGLFLYDKPTGELTQISKDDGRGLIAVDYLTGLFVDRTGCIWLIEDYLGVKCLRMNRLNFSPLLPSPHAAIEDANYIRSIAPVANDKVFVSTQTGDTYEYDIRQRTFHHLGNSRYRVYAALTDSRGRQWRGTRGDGLWVDGEKIAGLPSPHIFSIREGGAGTLWISMLEGGVARRSADGSMVFLISGHKAHDARPDKEGRLWVATEEGLFLFDSHLQRLDSIEGSFVCLHTDSSGTIWAGSTDMGLVQASVKGGKIAPTYYHRNNGLTTNSVLSIVEDRHGRLWMGTEEGLSSLDMASGDITNYHITGSLLRNVFSEQAAICLPDGHLLLGTMNGMIEVEPESGQALSAPTTTITNVLVNGEPPAAPQTLTYRQNNLNISFSNLQYACQESTIYQYWMEGTDESWLPPTTDHNAVYRSLPPGRYVFHVRSKTSGSQWGAEATMAFTIRQPWWNTWWAWVLYTCMITAAALVVLRILHLRRRIAMEQRMAAFRQDFYDQIERELRTPIHMVQGATENVTLTGTTKTTVQSLRRGSKRMLHIIDMIRQFHQTDAEQMERDSINNTQRTETAKRLLSIRQAIQAEEGEFKEMAPPAVNDQAILIIGSDDDSNAHLADTLNPYFHMYCCNNVGDGIEAIRRYAPALVIIDTGDDEKACIALTQTASSSHPDIPIIHLSDTDDANRQMRSFRAGAKDYVVKPFSGRVLQERVRIWLQTVSGQHKQQGETGVEQSLAAHDTKPMEVITKVKDKKFLDVFYLTLNSHVSDENFSVEQFAELMGLGRTQFYKKVKALTGQTPQQHVQRARLDYAARLIRETRLTIEEVMLRAGYRNSTHFYNAFKTQFGVSPKNMRQNY